MDTDLAPIDVAQHWPFLFRHLVRVPLAVERALREVSEAQVDTDGEAVSVRARFLKREYATAGEAGRMSVVLRELESRGVVYGRRGSGSRAHVWSFRPNIDRWRGFTWDAPVRDIDLAVTDCFCRAAGDLVARFPGQSLVQLRRRARYELLPRDHTRPPGLLLVDTREHYEGRATVSGRPGLSVVDTRDDGGEISAPTVCLQEVELLELNDGERARFTRLKTAVDSHCTAGSSVWAGTVTERTLVALARRMSDEVVRLTIKHFDKHAGRSLAPGQVTKLERWAFDFEAQEARRQGGPVAMAE